jgi:hypothetical protein
MLYYAGMNEPILSEAVWPRRSYPLAADLKLNAWAFVALATAVISRSLLHRHPGWDDTWRAGVALFPLLPSLLYARRLAGWMRGMDELQRRIQAGACLFAVTGTLFVATGLSLLGSAGVLEGTRLNRGLGWEGTFAVLVGIFILGNILSNRRYR